jgi:hypothetical protein
MGERTPSSINDLTTEEGEREGGREEGQTAYLGDAPNHRTDSRLVRRVEHKKRFAKIAENAPTQPADLARDKGDVLGREGGREGGKGGELVKREDERRIINTEKEEGRAGGRKEGRKGKREGGSEVYTQTYRRVRHGIQPQLLRQGLVRRADHPELCHLLLAQALPSLPPALQDVHGHIGVELSELGRGGLVSCLAEFLFREVELGGKVQGGGGGRVEEGD